MMLFRINHSDLEELERVVPELCDRIPKDTDPRVRAQIQRIKRILSDVRWDYQPHSNGTIIPGGQEEGQPQCPSN